jgi:hypothetical protein
MLLWRPAKLGLPSAILNSSILRPNFIAATSHLGLLPRPDHVSEGASGLRYLGSTRGYLRRVLPSGAEVRWPPAGATPRRRTAKRFSSSIFSARMRADSTLLISSWSDQSSSRGIDSNSIPSMAMPLSRSAKKRYPWHQCR